MSGPSSAAAQELQPEPWGPMSGSGVLVTSAWTLLFRFSSPRPQGTRPLHPLPKVSAGKEGSRLMKAEKHQAADSLTIRVLISTGFGLLSLKVNSDPYLTALRELIRSAEAQWPAGNQSSSPCVRNDGSHMGCLQDALTLGRSLEGLLLSLSDTELWTCPLSWTFHTP